MNVLSFPVKATKPVETKYLGLAETNKLLRQTLKAEFPGVKFTVRGKSYSGGSSTDIAWTDGPTVPDVDAIARPFGYKGFDGMIDMQYSYRQALLPSGRIVCVGTSGTEGSRGTVPAWSEAVPEGAVPVSSGLSYVFTRRTLSPAFVETVRASLVRLSSRDYCDLLNKAPHVWGADEAERIARITKGPTV
jgi:hypothetical protein